MIHIENLCFQYSKKEIILNRLNLNFEPGKTYGLLGKNGAGKSTIIKNISGILFPSSGSCTVNGYTPSKRKVNFLKDLFFVPEDYYLPNIPIYKLIDLYHNFYPKFDSNQFYDYVQLFKIDKTKRPNELSLGQRKKILIGFALSSNTKILIMDEPTNGLDIPSKVIFRNMINSSYSKERIVLISSHQVRDLDELISDIIIIDEGKVLLNKDKEHISRKLLFETSLEKKPDNQVLYQERVSNGYASVRKNSTQRSDYVDLELLFNAVLTDREITNTL